MDEGSSSHEFISFGKYIAARSLTGFFMTGGKLEGNFKISNSVHVFRTIFQFFKVGLQVSMSML